MSFTRRAFIKTSLASGVNLALPAVVAAQGSRLELTSATRCAGRSRSDLTGATLCEKALAPRA